MLTELAIRALKPRAIRYYVSDARGLALEVFPGGAMAWRYRYVRAWAAESESRVKWEIVREQLWYDESNPRKLPSQVKDAVSLLRVMWPGVNVRHEEDGIVFGKAKSYLIPVDEEIRRLQRGGEPQAPD